MQKVRDVKKKSQKYAARLEQYNFQVESLEEDRKIKKEINDAIKLCENCVSNLTSEQSNAKISNIEALIDRMLNF